MDDSIRLLQFMICKDFKGGEKDFYTAEGIHSNLYLPQFPSRLEDHYVVTCWRKDKRFHKEVIEYAAEGHPSVKTPPMDIEPVTNSVLFRWHKHAFPQELEIASPCLLTIRIILDWEVQFESAVMIEASNP